VTGRRVESVGEIEKPGDYAGPLTITSAAGDEQTCLFMGPGCDHLGRVAFPPHTYRECEDGSLEIRASIQLYPHGDCAGWHGWLSEGHIWHQA
jgi:hypothetical protein